MILHHNFSYMVRVPTDAVAHHITHDATAPSSWVSKGYLRSTSGRRGCERQQLWTREMDREREREEVMCPIPELSVHPMKTRMSCADETINKHGAGDESVLSTYAPGRHNSELSGSCLSWQHEQEKTSTTIRFAQPPSAGTVLIRRNSSPVSMPRTLSLSLYIHIYIFPCAIYICLYAKLSGVRHRHCMQQHNYYLLLYLNTISPIGIQSSDKAI
jgi:hypothetical protein